MKDLGKPGDHLRDVGRQPRFLGDHAGINVVDPQVPLVEHPQDTPQQGEAGNVLVLGIGIGKTVPDVAEPRCAQQGIADGVGERIGV